MDPEETNLGLFAVELTNVYWQTEEDGTPSSFVWPGIDHDFAQWRAPATGLLSVTDRRLVATSSTFPAWLPDEPAQGARIVFVVPLEAITMAKGQTEGSAFSAQLPQRRGSTSWCCRTELRTGGSASALVAR